MLGDNDNPELEGATIFAPSRLSLFLPVAVVFFSYSLLLILLVLAGKTEGTIAKLCILVLTAGIPFLFAHAWLRANTMRLTLTPRGAYLQRGFPRTQPVELPYQLIRSAAVRRGVGGRITGAGTLVFELINGDKVAACDLAEPDRAFEAVQQNLEPPQSPTAARVPRLKTPQAAAASR